MKGTSGLTTEAGPGAGSSRPHEDTVRRATRREQALDSHRSWASRDWDFPASKTRRKKRLPVEVASRGRGGVSACGTETAPNAT